MELLERASYVAELERLLGDLPDSGGRLVFLGGEAGVGKSVLVEAFCQRVGSPVRVLRGGCDPLSTPRPLGPLVDIADGIGGEVVRLLGKQGVRELIFRAVLDSLTARSPALVVFEDIHWADEATLDLLRYLGRRIGGTRALLVATYRDDEVGPRHPLRIVIGDLATASGIRRMSLASLSEDAVRELAASAGSALDPARLHRQTGGNPFFVTEVLAAGDAGVPPTVRDAVLARAARLSAAGREVLEAAAVVGASVEAPLLEAIVGGDGGAVEECVASGVLRAAGGGYAFRHEIARETMLDVLDPGRRAALHRAVLTALRDGIGGSVSLTRLAYHAEEAGDGPAVLEYGPAAARQAAAHQAHRQAATQYARTLRFASSIEPSERAELLEASAYASIPIGNFDHSIAAHREAAGIWRAAGVPLREAVNLSEMGKLLWLSGQPDQGWEVTRHAVGMLESLPPGPELARAYYVQASLLMLNRDNDEAIKVGWRAIELAERFGAERTVIDAYNTIGSAMLVSGDESGIEPLERSLELARAAGLAAAVSSAYGNLGSACGEIYRFAEADRYLADGIAYALERDFDYARLYAASWQALTHMYQGRWGEATDVAGLVLRTSGAAAISRIMALVALGRVRARRGDPEVRTVLDEALILARQADTLQRLAPAHAALAEAAWLAGDVAETAAQARAVYDLVLKHRHPWHSGEFTWWLRLAGEDVTPPEWIAEPWQHHLAGDWQSAADAWAARGCLYEQARALADGDEPALKEALAIFTQLAAMPMVGAVTRRLRELGARGVQRGPRPSTRSNPAGLTRRELEVLQHLAAGQRNADIAERLYLSPKTIERHVSAILAKLDVATRTEAARRASELGVLDA